MTISRRISTALHPSLLLLCSVVCSVHSRSVPLTSNLCPRENISSNQVESWPGSIIPYKMSNNLTDAVRREIMRVMEVWEKHLYYSIAFIPSHQQEQVMVHFVHFVPGGRCCSDRGLTSGRRQNVYIHDSCITDGTLEDVIGALIGNTDHRLSSNEEGEGLNSESRTNVNVTSGEEDPCFISADCQNTCIRHIAGRLNSRSRQGQLYSPNYPMEYPSNVECIWKITVPENSVLRLTFEDFDTECSHDYLEIHHLKTADGTIESLDRLCGVLTDHDAITSHLSIDSVLIRFHTDVTYNRRGFNISYEFVVNRHQCDIDNGGCSYKCETDSSGIGNCVCKPGFRVGRMGACKDINECSTDSHGCEQNCRNSRGSYQCSCNEGYALNLGGRLCNRCEEEFNMTEGIIQSTGYPGPYPDQQNCHYTVHIWPAYVLKLTLFVDIHRSASCKTEFLKLEHGYFMYNRRLCDYVNNISYYVKDSNATSTSLRFRTRNLNRISEHPSGGFRVEFQQVLRSSVTAVELNQVQIGSSTIEYQNRPWIS